MHRAFILGLLAATLVATRLAAADPSGDKSPEVAASLSVGGTLGSVAVILAGLTAHGHESGTITMIGFGSTLVTPSLGEWYAGKYVTPGMGLRVAGTVLGAAGVFNLNICFESPCKSGGNGGPLLLIGLGVASYATGVIWDIARSSSAAEEANARRHAPTITPSVMSSPSGRATYGLGVGGSF